MAPLQPKRRQTPPLLLARLPPPLAPAGLGHIIVQMKNGTLRTWGHDGWGQAGIGTHGGYQMKPATPKLTGVKASFAAQNRCFAITQDGKLWFWGPSYTKLPGLLRQNQYAPVDVTAAW
jgi:alpha-tubulin suppressor-like RCC1 family protein